MIDIHKHATEYTQRYYFHVGLIVHERWSVPSEGLHDAHQGIKIMIMGEDEREKTDITLCDMFHVVFLCGLLAQVS